MFNSWSLKLENIRAAASTSTSTKLVSGCWLTFITENKNFQMCPCAYILIYFEMIQYFRNRAQIKKANDMGNRTNYQSNF